MSCTSRASCISAMASSVFVLYPLVPWIGVMAAGYALGPVMQLEPDARQRLLFGLGAAVTLGFVLLRASQSLWRSRAVDRAGDLVGDRAVLPQLREISAVAALFDDDARPGLDAARRLRACARLVGACARDVRAGAVLLLCGAHLSDPRARRRRRPGHDRHAREQSRDRAQPCGHLSRSGCWCWCCSIRSAAGSPGSSSAAADGGGAISNAAQRMVLS